MYSKALVVIFVSLLMAPMAPLRAATPTSAVLHDFVEGADGGEPNAGLVADSQGRLYGTTTYGGNGSGVVFRLSPPKVADAKWKETILYSFCAQAECADGAVPVGPLLVAKNGVIYGIEAGVYPGYGGVFMLSPPSAGSAGWSETLIYTFQGGFDGGGPFGGLIADSAGNLYGTTFDGGIENGLCTLGSQGCGTVFRLSPPATAGQPWTKTVIFLATDGSAFPNSLAFDNSGGIVVTTQEGGLKHHGSILRLTPPAVPGYTWTSSLIYAFTGGTDGILPAPGLAVDQNGNIFGSTTFGGGSTQCTNGCGTIYRVDGSGTVTTVYRFGGQGTYPNGLLVDKNGNLFGLTQGGRVTGGCPIVVGCGTAFELAAVASPAGTWSFTTLHTFAQNAKVGVSGGAIPVGRLVADKVGNLYGATTFGGDSSCPSSNGLPQGCGVVFRVSNAPFVP